MSLREKIEQTLGLPPLVPKGNDDRLDKILAEVVRRLTTLEERVSALEKKKKHAKEKTK